ncbi:hypothetical protein HMPREF0673_00626 [Leyella stercorea DSM 18206]|uniref:Uncharacterized protein n=1 Tax=Leyella stercorea DSM 18206 TaxID=1002367 RepID=G6AVJ1_9BACT|nr:hypothetical protein HMPREF0673_00626 [Leyella stercorea DSM 18206]
MWNVECRIVGFADEEFINKEFIQHSTLRLCRDHSTFNTQHSTFATLYYSRGI